MLLVVFQIAILYFGCSAIKLVYWNSNKEFKICSHLFDNITMHFFELGHWYYLAAWFCTCANEFWLNLLFVGCCDSGCCDSGCWFILLGIFYNLRIVSVLIAYCLALLKRLNVWLGNLNAWHLWYNIFCMLLLIFYGYTP